MNANESLARRKLLGILAGSWTAQALYAVVELGVADQLADGPRHLDDLAVSCGADARALSRILRALASLGLFAQPEPNHFALTATSTLLRTDVPGSVRPNALLQGNEIFRSFADIMHTVRTGEPAFTHVYGRGFYEYLADHPDVADTFNLSMGDQGVPAALSTCDIGGARRVVDVGGGDGQLLVDLLSQHPHLRGVLVELPDAIRLARSRIARAGLDDRIELVAGSFFDELPRGGDIYVLSRVLHNWADEKAVVIAGRCHEAMTGGARLWVLEDLVPEPATATGRSAATMIDLLMLVTLDGWERTEQEYRALLHSAGFGDVDARRASGNGTSGVVEAMR